MDQTAMLACSAPHLLHEPFDRSLRAADRQKEDREQVEAVKPQEILPAILQRPHKKGLWRGYKRKN